MIKAGFFVVIAAVVAYYKITADRYKSEIKDIEIGSAKSQLEALAEAEEADRQALKRGDRRSADAINRARNGDRSHFE